jgi:hypothetical protein
MLRLQYILYNCIYKKKIIRFLKWKNIVLSKKILSNMFKQYIFKN